jgi:hypothetical protein
MQAIVWYYSLRLIRGPKNLPRMDLENKEVMQTGAQATDIKVARHVGRE